MRLDVGVELGGRIKLRIATDDLHLLLGDIGEIDKVADHLPQSSLIKQPLNHTVQGVDAILHHRLIPFNLAPRIEELIGGKQRTRLTVHPITEDAERVVLHQLRDITRITGSELNIGIVNGRLFSDRTLKLKHHQRQTVDIENAIGDTLLAALNLQLVDDAVAVGIGRVVGRSLGDVGGGTLHGQHFSFAGQSLIIDKLDIEILLGVVLALEQKTIRDPLHDRLVGVVEIKGRWSLQLADHRLNLSGGDLLGLIVLCQIVAQIRLDEDLVRLPTDRLPL